MNKDYGIKIAKANKSILSTDVRNLLFSSKFSMFKYHKDMVGAVTFTPGDTEKTVDFEHQLGYTPAFIAYAKNMNGQYQMIPSISYPSGPSLWAYAYADSLKIRCGLRYGTGAYNKITPSYSDFWASRAGGTNTRFKVGGEDPGFGTSDGAYRFTNITIPQGSTIVSAILSSKVDQRGSSTSDVKIKIYGIAEDNTASFSSDPMGRTKTTAYTSENVALPAVGGTSNHDVTTQLQEIINRSGFASGNAVGFLFFNNISPDNAWWLDSGGNPISILTVTYGSNATLTFRTIIFKNKIA